VVSLQLPWLLRPRRVRLSMAGYLTGRPTRKAALTRRRRCYRNGSWRCRRGKRFRHSLAALLARPSSVTLTPTSLRHQNTSQGMADVVEVFLSLLNSAAWQNVLSRLGLARVPKVWMNVLSGLLTECYYSIHSSIHHATPGNTVWIGFECLVTAPRHARR
jgi:hypothetical protein